MPSNPTTAKAKRQRNSLPEWGTIGRALIKYALPALLAGGGSGTTVWLNGTETRHQAARVTAVDALPDGAALAMLDRITRAYSAQAETLRAELAEARAAEAVCRAEHP